MKSEEIFGNLKVRLDKIKDDAVILDKKDEASGTISFIGMILDELSNSIKKGNFDGAKGLTENLNDEYGLKTLLDELEPYLTEKNTTDRLDELAIYCDKIFMGLMSENSCSIPSGDR